MMETVRNGLGGNNINDSNFSHWGTHSKSKPKKSSNKQEGLSFQQRDNNSRKRQLVHPIESKVKRIHREAPSDSTKVNDDLAIVAEQLAGLAEPMTNLPSESQKIKDKKPIITSPKRVTETLRLPHVETESKKHLRPCNCKHSRCLKLYCECYRARLYCKDCNCVGCQNTPDNAAEVQQSVEHVLGRDSKAFAPKISHANEMKDKKKHSRGCKCSKSGCLKNYCECYQAGIPCSENCRCIYCKNVEGARHIRHQKMENPPQHYEEQRRKFNYIQYGTQSPEHELEVSKSPSPQRTRIPIVNKKFNSKNKLDSARSIIHKTNTEAMPNITKAMLLASEEALYQLEQEEQETQNEEGKSIIHGTQEGAILSTFKNYLKKVEDQVTKFSQKQNRTQ